MTSRSGRRGTDDRRTVAGRRGTDDRRTVARASEAVAATLILALAAAACAGPGPATPAPSAAPSATAGAPAATGGDAPFAPGAWPASGSACGRPGYTGLLGRVEAVSARTVRFDLCRPDGAFLARLAHPAMGIVDAATVAAVAADPLAARAPEGAGSFRVEAWAPGDNVRLERTGGTGDDASPAPPASARTGSPAARASGTPGGGAAASGAPAAPSAGSVASPGASGTSGSAPPGGPPGTVVLRWAASDTDRATLVRDATVDGATRVDPASAAAMGTLPELAVLPRPALATAYLGFGTGAAFTGPVRRAFAQALDRAAIAALLPPGTSAATHVAPCEVPGGCAGRDWWDPNGPAAAQALIDAGYDRKPALLLRIPDAPVPGLPDPAAVAAAVRDQLRDSVRVGVTIRAMPAADLGARIASGRVDGLYLWGVESALADPAGFLEPLFGRGARSTAAARARGVRAALTDAARATGAAPRAAAFAAANDLVRATAPIVPLVHPGSVAAFRADVAGAAVSAIGADPYGAMVPGDRRQLVVAAGTEPAGAWCGAGGAADAAALCALVTPGLYGFDGAGLAPVPALASSCTPNDDATEWTCRLRARLRTPGGHRIDASDVLATVRGVADATGPLRAALPTAAFAAWDALLGGPVPTAPSPTAGASGSAAAP